MRLQIIWQGLLRMRVAEGFGMRATPLCNSAVLAFRLSGFAHIAAMKNEPMMRFRHHPFRKMLHERLLCGERSLGISCESYAVADPEHMGVDSHRRLVPNHGEHDVGSLAPHPGELHKIVDV